MKKRNYSFFALLPLVAALFIISCSKEESTDITTPNATLQVKTGNSDGDTTVSYPVQVYVFQGEVCRAVQTIGDAGQTLSIPLVEGTYTLYAIGGAAHTDYTLPGQNDATPASIITLNSGHSHADLMTATATATLVDGGTNTVVLGMERKTLMIQDVTISQVPAAATAVSITIAPLWQNITVDGNYDGAAGNATIALSQQGSSRTWVADDSVNLLPPSSQPASISVNITVDGTTQSYTYSSSDQLEAGYKISIDGTYTEAVGVTLSGTITGATWQGEHTISFTFNSGGTSDNGSDNGNNSGFPTVGDTYQGCYVLASEVATDGQSTTVTLLSPNETTCHPTSNEVTAAVTQCSVAGISGWAVPTQEQMILVSTYLHELSPTSSSKYLYRMTNGNYGYRQINNSIDTGWGIEAVATTSYYLRPVAVVTLTND